MEPHVERLPGDDYHEYTLGDVIIEAESTIIIVLYQDNHTRQNQTLFYIKHLQ